MEAITIRLEAIALEAMAIRLEAIALQAIATRLEAIPIRLEAIAIRLEAITTSSKKLLIRLEATYHGHSMPGLRLRLPPISLISTPCRKSPRPTRSIYFRCNKDTQATPGHPVTQAYPGHPPNGGATITP